MELPSAWSGSNRIGVEEEETRTVEVFDDEAAPLDGVAAARRGVGIIARVAAAVAVLRNSRRERSEVFMGTAEV
jgi:hypothetical protein